MEASSRDIHLHDDDADAIYGLLAFCYGLRYEGNRTWHEATVSGIVNYHGDNEGQHLRYIISLYVVGGKYMLPQLEAHAEANFTAVMEALVREDDVFHENSLQGDELALVFESTATLLYANFGDNVKKLRPALARTIQSHAAGLVDNETFKQLMMPIPELSFDVLALATKKGTHKNGASSSDSPVGGGKKKAKPRNTMMGLFD